MKRWMYFFFLLLAVACTEDRDFSDVADIRFLTEHFQDTDSVASYLKKEGYQYKGWVHAEGLNDFYGSHVYHKNCTANKKGEPVSLGKGNGSVVELASVGFGPCVVVKVFNAEIHQHLVNEIVKMGFKKEQETPEDDTGTYTAKDIAIDAGKFGQQYFLTIRRNI